MTEILLIALLLAGLVALVRFARHDAFAGPSLRREPRVDLGDHHRLGHRLTHSAA